jgi:hypothetical protein
VPTGLAYGEVNVFHIRIERLDTIQCVTPVALRAHLTDKSGAAVAGATVNWTLKKGQPEDVLSPTTSASDASGDADTELQFSNFQGPRIVVASVTGAQGSGKDQITIVAKKGDTGCTQQPGGEGGVEGATGAPVTLPPTTTVQDELIPAAAGQVLPVVGILTGVALLSLLTTMAWRKRASRRLPPA